MNPGWWFCGMLWQISDWSISFKNQTASAEVQGRLEDNRNGMKIKGELGNRGGMKIKGELGNRGGMKKRGKQGGSGGRKKGTGRQRWNEEVGNREVAVEGRREGNREVAVEGRREGNREVAVEGRRMEQGGSSGRKKRGEQGGSSGRKKRGEQGGSSGRKKRGEQGGSSGRKRGTGWQQWKEGKEGDSKRVEHSKEVGLIWRAEGEWRLLSWPSILSCLPPNAACNATFLQTDPFLGEVEVDGPSCGHHGDVGHQQQVVRGRQRAGGIGDRLVQRVAVCHSTHALVRPHLAVPAAASKTAAKISKAPVPQTLLCFWASGYLFCSASATQEVPCHLTPEAARCRKDRLCRC